MAAAGLAVAAREGVGRFALVVHLGGGGGERIALSVQGDAASLQASHASE